MGRICLLTVLAASLLGCEAPLILDGIEAELERPIRRSDRFQAAVDNGKTLVVVGAYGVILTSGDDGDTWSRRQIEEQPSFVDATACPDGSIAVLAFERKIWISTDDGKSWQGRDIESEETPQAITCDPGGRLWVVGSFASILSTEDFGGSWNAQSLDDDLILNYAQFFDERQGLVMGEFGTVARTGDGGQTWELTDPLPNEFYPMAAMFIDPQRGWVAGLHGTILYTEDGGRNWQRSITETDAPIYGFASQKGDLFAVGGFGSVLRHVGNEFSDERHWELQDPGYDIRFFLRAVLPVKDDRLLIGGGAGALYVINSSDLAKS
jgi:photosystem II stability/assembly factor-like uncharacterized protein